MRGLSEKLRLSRYGAGLLTFALSTLIAGLTLGSAVLLTAAVFATMLLVLAFCTLLLPHRITVDRSITGGELSVGDIARVELHIRVEGVLPVRGTWVEELPHVLKSSPARGVFTLHPSTETRVSYEVRATVRGVHSLGPLSLVFEDPFGLVRRRITAAGSATVVVLPETLDLEVPSTRAAAHRAGVPTAVAHWGVTTQLDVVAREYAPGDGMNRVHWRASARRGELMVRQDEPERMHDVRIVLDARAECWPGALRAAHRGLSLDSFERAVTLGASLSALYTRLGRSVEVHILGGGGADLPASSRAPRTHSEVLTALAHLRFETESTAVSHANTPHHRTPPQRRTPPYATVVLVTGLLDHAGAMRLEAHVPAQVRGGERTVVFSADLHAEGEAAAEALGWVCVELHDPAESWHEALRLRSNSLGAGGAHA